MEVSLVPAHMGHAIAIAESVRPEDRDELWASCMMQPLNAMERGMRHSHAMTGCVDDVPVCMWGVVPEDLLLKAGTPWMVCSSLIETCEKTFLRRTKAGVMTVFDKYDMLQNYVDARNGRAIRWLSWLGFTIDEPEPYGMLKLPFHKFWKRGG